MIKIIVDDLPQDGADISGLSSYPEHDQDQVNCIVIIILKDQLLLILQITNKPTGVPPKIAWGGKHRNKILRNPFETVKVERKHRSLVQRSAASKQLTVGCCV